MVCILHPVHLLHFLNFDQVHDLLVATMLNIVQIMSISLYDRNWKEIWWLALSRSGARSPPRRVFDSHRQLANKFLQPSRAHFPEMETGKIDLISIFGNAIL
jgi:hypothetical protein